MNLNKAVYHSARVGFGLSHLVFQTLADLSIDAEVSVVKRTGVYVGNKRSDIIESNYRLERLKATAIIQQKSADRIRAFKQELLLRKAKLKVA